MTDEGGPAADIYRTFRAHIASGRLGAGERLPTVRQAAVDLGVAPGTVAKAYKLLERDGIITTRVGSGTRVAESAAVLPAGVVRGIRALIAEADHAGVEPDDVVAVLRETWRSG